MILQTEELEELVQQGQELVKELSNKVKLFNRDTDRQMKMERITQPYIQMRRNIHSVCQAFLTIHMREET